jgi:hypothetical protein
MTMIVGLTFALFTDGDKVNTHLKAGDLEVAMTRTNLEYRYLDAYGEWKVVTEEADVNLASLKEGNAFGLDAKDMVIVPGCYFNADIKVDNVGNVAFTYEVSIQTLGEVNELAEQLEVTVTRSDGTTITKRLSAAREEVLVSRRYANVVINYDNRAEEAARALVDLVEKGETDLPVLVKDRDAFLQGFQK